MSPVARMNGSLLSYSMTSLNSWAPMHSPPSWGVPACVKSHSRAMLSQSGKGIQLSVDGVGREHVPLLLVETKCLGGALRCLVCSPGGLQDHDVVRQRLGAEVQPVRSIGERDRLARPGLCVVEPAGERE